jgi:hypothetical protein
LTQFGSAYSGVESTLFALVALLLGFVHGKRERAVSDAELAASQEA